RAPAANGSGVCARAENGDCHHLGGFFLLARELAVTLERAREMVPHRLARRFRLARGDGVVDALMLFLDEREVSALAAHALGQAGDRAPRNEMAADELQEAREFRIAGRLRNRAVKTDVLLDRRAIGFDRLRERLQRSRY